MKPVKRILATLTKAALLAGLAVNFNACSEQSPMSSQSASFSNEGGFKIIQLNPSNSLSKLVNVTEVISAANGGTLQLEHGKANGTFIYGNENSAPYNIYQIDPANPRSSVLVGQLDFGSSAMAMHPLNGLLYYVAKYSSGGIYQVATWDPTTNTSTVLPQGSSFKPAYKLAFAPDGTLYSFRDQNNYTDELYTINTTTGQWSFVRYYWDSIDDDGDLAIGPDGKMYNLNEYYRELQILSLNSPDVTIVDYVCLDDLSGMVFGHDGTMYVCTDDNKKLYTMNPANGNTTYLGTTNLSEIDDLAPVVALTELSYANVSLQFGPGAINQDIEMSLSIETTELLGGVAITFSPHGTNFNNPAILNIEAHGVDLTGLDSNSIDVYYDNQNSGQWQKMQRDDVIVDVNAGTIQVINARLPHFSRYAIGAE